MPYTQTSESVIKNLKKEKTRCNHREKEKRKIVSEYHWSNRKRKNGIFLDIARERNKLWRMKITTVPIIVGALWIVSKSLAKRMKLFEI